MRTAATAFWEELLEYIDERRVIPVIGVELLRAAPSDPAASFPLDLARRVAERLGVTAPDLPEDDALNAVAMLYVAQGGRREKLYPALRSILRDMRAPVPAPLRALARIPHFNLFVSTTVDGLMEQALNEERFAGASGADSLAFLPSGVPQDLPCPMRSLTRPLVYHLMGRPSTSAYSCALTEEDTLEFFSALQTERRPKLLFDELRDNHLLLIGNRFPDWLVRFFIRTTKGGRLSTPRDSSEIIADRVARGDSQLVMFLRNFSYQTQIYEGGDAAEFVHELAERYGQRYPAAADGGATNSPQPASEDSPGPGEMSEGAIFLSYAHEDKPAAQAIRDALHAKGVDVWFDRHCLTPGDEWDQKIRRHLRACSFFIPLISANTNARERGYFRKEWRWAVDLADETADGVAFILPAMIDTSDPAEAAVPDRFRDFQWTALPEGKVTPEFAEKIVHLIREYRKRQRGRA